MDPRRVGFSHPLRYPAARDFVLSDALAVALSHPAGQWHPVGSTRHHDSELCGAYRRVRVMVWTPLPAAENGSSRQNYWDRGPDTIDFAANFEGAPHMRLAMIVSLVVLVTVVVTGLAAYVLNKLNRS